MIKAALSLIVLIFAALSANAVESPAIIRVQPKVAYAGSSADVTLGDIATFEGFGAVEQARLSRLTITDAPTVGNERTFSRQTLAQVLRAEFAETAEKPRLILPERLLITRKTLIFDRAAVSAELLKKFKQICGSCEFELTQLNLPIISQKLDASMSWALKVRPELPHGTFSIALEISGAPANSNLYWVTGDVIIRKKVPVATRNISLGEKISAQDFSFTLKDITYVTDSTPERAELESSIASRSVQADQVIGRSALRRESDVRYGQNVKVVTGSSDWQLSIEGVAQQNASIGDEVKVKIGSTQKSVSGVLTAKGIVEVR